MSQPTLSIAAADAQRGRKHSQAKELVVARHQGVREAKAQKSGGAASRNRFTMVRSAVGATPPARRHAALMLGQFEQGRNGVSRCCRPGDTTATRSKISAPGLAHIPRIMSIRAAHRLPRTIVRFRPVADIRDRPFFTRSSSIAHAAHPDCCHG
jgi:hypothetical protein